MKKKILTTVVIDLIIAVVAYYFLLPPLNIQSPAFWSFLAFIFIAFWLIYAISSIGIREIKTFNISNPVNINFKGLKGFTRSLAVFVGIILVIFVMNTILSPLFQSKKYANRITVDETKSFQEDVATVDFTTLPLLDKASSEKLGDRTMGQMTDLVSQFYVSSLYTQINYNNDIIRVTPLEYADIIKYFTNRNKGVEGYITVNSVDGTSNLVRLESGMRYMPSALFSEDLARKLRFSHPTEIFGEYSFEIDNEGNPYWIVPTIRYAGIGMLKEIDGAIILDAVTGESKKYELEDIPTWVDHVFSADLIIEQFDNWGEYKNGFWNSIFGQKGVVNTTDGYNYMAMNDDIYLYTGVTSVSSDESNLGFILTNMRTKATNYYAVPGAEEYSAMASAEGLVQEKDYVSTFPLLINLNNRATYLMSLKDNAGLVKMYAFVDVEDYQKVVTSDASLGIEVAATKYLTETSFESTNSEVLSASIELRSITSAIIDGTTYYYLTDLNNIRYSASIKVAKDLLPFLKPSDKLDIKYTKEQNISNIVSIENK